MLKKNVTEEWLDYCETDKEKEIISKRINYESNNKMALDLGLCRKTIDRYVNIIYKRMQVETNDNLFIKGTSTLFDANGNLKLRWVKTEVEKEKRFEAFKEAVFDIMKDLREERIKVTDELNFEENDLIKDFFNEDLLTVYPIGDLHLGMFAWDDESGENYDLKIAKELLLKSFERMVESAPNSEKALLANLGDFFHIDDTRNETLKSGNRLDVDSRYPKILKTGLELIIKIIEKLLSKHYYVIIRNAIGNHDPHTSYFLNEYIKAWFCNNPRIIIEDETKTFWFYKFGKNLIGITHGDTCKLTDLPEIMAADASKHWSNTEFRYWYIGHVHHLQKKEFRTCIVESFGTLAAKDAWHSAKGYRSQRTIKYKVLHKDYGEVQDSTLNVEYINKYNIDTNTDSKEEI